MSTASRGLALQCSSYASIMLSAIIPPKSVPIIKHNWAIPKHHAVSQSTLDIRKNYEGSTIILRACNS